MRLEGYVSLDNSGSGYIRWNGNHIVVTVDGVETVRQTLASFLYGLGVSEAEVTDAAKQIGAMFP